LVVDFTGFYTYLGVDEWVRQENFYRPTSWKIYIHHTYLQICTKSNNAPYLPKEASDMGSNPRGAPVDHEYLLHTGAQTSTTTGVCQKSNESPDVTKMGFIFSKAKNVEHQFHLG
jgi:hypothetical protein